MKQNNSKGQLTAQVNLGQQVKSGFQFNYPFMMTGRIGRIYNTRCMHVNPADYVKGKSIASVQFEPLAVPILNNMHVKQEHFYVPFNTVWKNWDKFISGGENLDYQGKVPSLSLASMFRSFFEGLGNSGVFGTIPVNVVDIGGNITEINILKESASVPLRDVPIDFYVFSDFIALENYQLLDLFDHVKEVDTRIKDYLDSFFKAYPNVNNCVLFKQGNLTATDELYSLNDTNPNKYLKKIWKSVYNYSRNSGITYMPTTEGLVVTQYLYELIKPFFGQGSYLDSLGYNKLRYEDFLYLVLCRVSTMREVGEYNLSISDLYSLMSDQPQSILPLRAQYSVWWNNYRDQLLETGAPEPSVEDTISDLEMLVLLCPRLRCWHKDTFTTALDSAGTVNAVVPTGNTSLHSTVALKYKDIEGVAAAEVKRNDMNIYRINFANEQPLEIPTGFISGMHASGVEKDAATTQYFSLGMLDAVQRAQKWLRKAIFFGNRIQDFLYTHFGVQYLDARLRLPELMATSSKMVDLTAVINPTTIATDKSETIAGDRSAIAHAFDDNGGYYERFIEEHGVIISNLTILPDVAYSNGFNRDLAMLDQFDFPFEEFATLGLDAVYDVELSQKPVKVYNVDPSEGTPTTLTDVPLVFGYQGRYYSFKAKHGEQHGELLDAMDMYTFARNFNIYDPDSLPKLNYIFVHCHPSLEMFVVNDTMSDYFRCDILHDYEADRLLPVHSLYM